MRGIVLDIKAECVKQNEFDDQKSLAVVTVGSPLIADIGKQPLENWDEVNTFINKLLHEALLFNR